LRVSTDDEVSARSILIEKGVIVRENQRTVVDRP
jgi:hypothetical protein